MENLVVVARERGCRVVTLTAGDGALVPVFSRYGFKVEDNALARDAMAIGVTVPMERPVCGKRAVARPPTNLVSFGRRRG